MEDKKYILTIAWMSTMLYHFHVLLSPLNIELYPLGIRPVDAWLSLSLSLSLFYFIFIFLFFIFSPPQGDHRTLVLGDVTLVCLCI